MQHFHPELGYLLPTAQLRRSVRRALVAGAFGAMCGAIGVLALTHPHDSALADGEAALAAAPLDALTDAGIQTPLDAASIARRTDQACRDQTWPLFDTKCLSGTAPPKWRRVRTIVRSEPAPAVETESTSAAVDAIASTAKQTRQPNQPATSSKKPHRMAQNREKTRIKFRKQVDPYRAYATPNRTTEETLRRDWTGNWNRSGNRSWNDAWSSR